MKVGGVNESCTGYESWTVNQSSTFIDTPTFIYCLTFKNAILLLGYTYSKKKKQITYKKIALSSFLGIQILKFFEKIVSNIKNRD